MVKYLWVLLAFALCSKALAQPSTNFDVYDEFGTAIYGAGIGGLSPGSYVSGTNNMFWIEPKMYDDAIPESAPEVSQVRATRVVVRVNEWTVCDQQGAWEMGPNNLIPAVRFSTSPFGDGSTVEIDVEIEYVLTTATASVFRTFTHTFNMTCYNKLQTLGNDRNALGVYNATYESDSNATTASAVAALPNYTASPGATATSETKASILAKIKPSTIFCASTHGGTGSLDDSDSSEDVLFAHATQDCIKKEVDKKAADAIPKFMLAAVWSCSTTGGTASTDGFQLTGQNRAYLGFAGNVSLVAWQRTTWDLWDPSNPATAQLPDALLSSHADWFWDRTSAGDRVGEALEKANDGVVTVSSSYAGSKTVKPSQLPMSIEGDPYTQLKFVFLEQVRIDNGANPFVFWIRLDSSGTE